MFGLRGLPLAAAAGAAMLIVALASWAMVTVLRSRSAEASQAAGS